MFPNEPGLSNEEVKRRQLQYGANVLPEKPPPSQFSLILQQLRNPFVYVLLVAALVTSIIGHFSDALIIFLAVFINTILGFIQESRANNALYALKHYVTSKATVIRNGQRISINTSDIVPGDLVVLDQGTKISADGKLTFANRLYIDEAVLTGESLPVNKNKDDSVFMGTVVSSGQATFLVEAIGATSKMGTIALQIQEEEEDTPLQRQLKGFSKQLVSIICVLTVAVFVLGLLYKFSLVEIFITSVALAVSSIPEGLLVSLTVVLAIGMQKIVKHRGLVRKLSAAETLGGVTVICVDKTGTLTQGKMEVVDYLGDKRQLAEQVLLANDLDDPIVISAFEWGRTIISDFVSEHSRLDSIPFSSKERFFMSLHEWSEKNNILFVNGAPEQLLGWTTLSEAEKKAVIQNINDLTKQGKRLIGFAKKEVPLGKNSLKTDDAKEGLTWVGILAFSDPVRSGVEESLKLAYEAGIRTIVITGDYSTTAEFVLTELGMGVKKDELLLGSELEKLTVEELAQKVKSIKLFARTTPDQKLMIVEALKRNGEIVAMMGDGVNDAPALHKADIGIVVNEATDVAKESADLVLLDSNFATIVGAIEQGRAMFENIRKIILYLMSDAFAEIIVVVGGIVMGLPLPITAAQILWINLISDGFPDLALTIDPQRANIMKEGPRPPQEKLVNRWMIVLISLVSLTAGLIALSSFVIVYKMTNDIVTARSVAFITLGLNSLAYVFSVRSLMTPFWKNHLFENKWLVVAVIAGLGLQVVPFMTPSLRQFFGLSELDSMYWIVAIGLSILMFFVIEVFKMGYKLNVVKHWVR
ncbi:MAG: Calcium-translocating P-type ATPase, PMCA-type [Candidatus Woesebacteria bacterium GW2011_GWB1_39_10]|uniref:Calcium-translocating P-type ATPase, PMCA-type n=2 Tax=Candidatus Woeseibacteriota TaxID=1752722 RepID=A0A0G0X6M5_9BACT|nr:MAG: Calcium-translocating P-type ATPase, PMCA-type [Candidatus Woesebacteria bacterium GW2011_GWB1_39_10]KKR92315.1 MAG: Calcium-translocating P-type ATPase, PMCA-type [Candidatus Woesebacteria bacterium GW2011_GWA1_41_13b]